jgi:hypothetical protein
VRLIRMFTGDDDRTHFDVLALPSPDEAERVRSTAVARARGECSIRSAIGASEPDFHTATARRCMVVLDGAIELLSTSGATAVVNSGDAVLVEDLTGEGHLLRMRGCREWTALFIPLDADGDLPARQQAV